MEAWSGNILLKDGLSINDIHLTQQPHLQPTIISASSLQFLAIVDIARVPLHLAIGPSHDLWTSATETEAWFSKTLLVSPASERESKKLLPWWELNCAQSPIGILAQIVYSDESTPVVPRPTEILFYGSVTRHQKGFAPPSPPRSSPGAQPVQDEEEAVLHIHALPLSSDLAHAPGAVITPPLSPTLPGTSSEFQHAQFLPTLAELREKVIEPLDKGKKRLSDVFDDATEKRKKARRRSGAAVSAAASKLDENRPVVPNVVAVKRKKDIQAPQPPAKGNSNDPPAQEPQSKNPSNYRPRGAHSRSPSLTSEPRLPSHQAFKDTAPNKRSSLSRVTSVSNLPEDSPVETRNKDAISRITMAGMRLYGLQQQRQPRGGNRRIDRSRGGSPALGPPSHPYQTASTSTSKMPTLPGSTPKDDQTATPASEDPDEIEKNNDEYKRIYHQTYKGAVFAFRKQIATVALHMRPERLREVVDKLLAIFCEDEVVEVGLGVEGL
ncbi:hypothetical protein K402DRAFT_451736 [Aulographum hederae CBS 113979]|uniref:Sld7 C-terminal domain-containing protein n=1 Tax=Aulographum hederae CBS 113979 TaxID=1176131 RepID=A0A6G1HAI9_9PEZI|nr:hypothetical protein K402DRAFT_451736 [Aulographum hederae CBS 113979]